MTDNSFFSNHGSPCHQYEYPKHRVKHQYSEVVERHQVEHSRTTGMGETHSQHVRLPLWNRWSLPPGMERCWYDGSLTAIFSAYGQLLYGTRGRGQTEGCGHPGQDHVKLWQEILVRTEYSTVCLWHSWFNQAFCGFPPILYINQKMQCALPSGDNLW